MKKNLVRFIALFAAAVILTGAAVFPEGAVSAADPSGVISVNGYGRIALKPDTAILTIGVRSRAETAEAAYNESALKINAVIAAIGKAGVSDVRTAEHSLYQEYERMAHKPSVFTAVTMLRAALTDLDLLPEVYAAAVAAGANADSGLQFSIKDRAAADAAALSLAADDAGKKAAAIARSLGLTLGAPVEVTESLTFGGEIYRALAGAEGGADMKAAVRENIKAGEIEVEARLSVKYRY